MRKRGRTTGLTGGVVTSVYGNGTAQGRSFTDAIIITPNSNSAAQLPLTFCESGDSGSAIVNEHNKIIGMLFAGSTKPDPKNPPPPTPRIGLAQSIDSIIKRFQTGKNIKLTVATAERLSDVQHTPSAPAHQPQPSALQLRLEADLARTPRGRALAQMWIRHSSELNHLINSNRRVALRWHRSGGAQLFQHLVLVTEPATFIVPSEVAGRTVDDCVDEITATFAQFGSPDLRRDLDQWRQLLPPLAGRTYEQLLASLSAFEQSA